MGFLRWEPLPSRHWSLHIPLPLPATGATSREVWPPGAIKFATLQHPALALATLCCWSSLCYCSGRALAPGCQAPLCSLLPSKPGLTAHLSPVSWQELLLLSAGESEHWGKRLQDPRCTGRTIPGHSVPAAAIVRSKHQRRGRCGRAGDGPAESRWEHAYLHLPGEGRGGRREDSWLPVAPSFPLRRLGAQERSPGWGTGEAGEYTALL